MEVLLINPFKLFVINGVFRTVIKLISNVRFTVDFKRTAVSEFERHIVRWDICTDNLIKRDISENNVISVAG